MRLLLDTHLLIWAAGWPAGASPLSPAAVELIGDLQNQPLFSPVSIWEIAIKTALGRPDFAVDPRTLRRQLLDNGYDELPFNSLHAIAVGDLPLLHKDPFDRLLVAQASVEGVTLLTADLILAGYPGPILKV